jgi:hypothetical protein
MTLACARLGCTERAHTVLVFEPGSAAAWLMHAVEAHRSQGILLCRAHADVITVPVGWNLVDERDPTWEPIRGTEGSAPAPDPEPAAAAKAKPEPPFREADVVEIASAAPETVLEPDRDEPAAEAAGEDNAVFEDTAAFEDDAAFEEVVAAQWTDAPDTAAVDPPTLFAVDDKTGDDENPDDENHDDENPDDENHDGTAAVAAPADTPLLNRAFRAAERI